MSYISIEFAVSFLILFIVYWLARPLPRLQNGLLLLASYGLLASFNYWFAIHLVVYTLVIYLLSLGIAFLFLFKYFDFAREFFQDFLQFAGLDLVIPAIEIILPIGISYYTFHTITYLVSLYREEIDFPPIDNFALFLAFFPTLVAGPINRATKMLPHLAYHKTREIKHINLIYVLVILAIAKKLWLSAYLSDNWVQPILMSSSEHHGLTIIAGVYAYALQIFLDFSGYTDLMIALALLLGFNIPINFNMPYMATNIRDFWRRWHISLSNWIRDYIYFPLGGSYHGFVRTQINVAIAMVLSGIWHGVGLSFIVWGSLHGVAIIFLNITDKLFGKERLSDKYPYFSRWLTFHFVCLTWIFFYAPTLTDSWDIVTAIATQMSWQTIPMTTIFFIALMPVLLWIYPLMKNTVNILANGLSYIPWIIRPIIFTALLLGIILLSPEGIPAFIYATF